MLVEITKKLQVEYHEEKEITLILTKQPTADADEDDLFESDSHNENDEEQNEDQEDEEQIEFFERLI